MRLGGLFLIYLVVGLLVAGDVIGNEGNYFSGISNLEEVAELVLAVLLWPLVLLDVNINLGGSESGATSSGSSSGGSTGGGGKGN